MQEQQNSNQPKPHNTGRMGAEQQQDRDLRETELDNDKSFEGVSLDDDEDKDEKDDKDSKDGIFAPDETEVGMDKEDYRDNVEKKDVGPDRSDKRL